MEADFIKLYKEYFSTKRSLMPQEQADAHERFALGNRSRASEFLGFIKNKLDYEFHGKTVLDIGSAYGGFVIKSAEKGAIAYGVEIDQRLHDFALANSHGERGEINLYRGDILDPSALPTTVTFDLIIINDVFEHIYDSEKLFRRLNALSNENTIIYFSIPNGQSYYAIEKEGHFFKFGLTLLEPSEWYSVVGGFNVYYRPLRIFQHYFRDIGFPWLYITIDNSRIGAVHGAIQKKYDEIERAIRTAPFPSATLNQNIARRFHLLRLQYAEDCNVLDDEAIHINYEQYFWTGFASRSELAALNESKDIHRL